MFQMTMDQALSLAPSVMTAGRTISEALGASPAVLVAIRSGAAG
jgi:hypothetical protein